MENLKRASAPGKAVVIYRVRRTGKTTMLQQFLRDVDEPYLLVSGEEITVQGYLARSIGEPLTGRKISLNLFPLAQQEIDFVEERGGTLSGFEMKWGRTAGKPLKKWLETYPNATWQIVNRQNYLEFVT